MAETTGEGEAEAPPELLYSQHYIDESILRDNIRRELAVKPQISLKEICESCPIEKGLSELIAYMVIASRESNSIIDMASQQIIEYNDNGRMKRVSLPMVIFCS
jgi:hypothetical protein